MSLREYSDIVVFGWHIRANWSVYSKEGKSEIMGAVY